MRLSRRSVDYAASVTIFRSAHIAGLSHRNNSHESSARRDVRAPRMARLRNRLRMIIRGCRSQLVGDIIAFANQVTAEAN
jgi:hypothetical protein